ncbi:lycopene cyclase domain-containing protein [Aeromicrobium choanae]|uniref:Lycopene cyclase domain-containing protein n=1 Tax=Aeromicrobium choanae TaxID=1736691 RepID=A0A1T4YZM2_9ACTN|nr:lycopene cyclase domain-containing protein [Aeromicrobium choanae]SKB06998.1 lycopene cyclase domain-containing protein [Aeromicrobium choanae]
MSWLYLASVIGAGFCMGLVDHRWRLFLFRKSSYALVVLAVGFVFFLVWDVVAIRLEVYARGESPAMTGIEVARELPLEELFFIVFLTYVTGVLHGLFTMLLDRRAVAR